MYVEASPETILSEKYAITEHIEEGAADFKAFGYERRTGRSVFMKARSAENSDHYALRTYNEAEQLESFHHPQIPTLVEAGQSNTHAYLVMERMPGNPYVQKWLARYPNHELAARLTLSAAGVLAAVHERKKVHRDVKESNLRMRWSGRVSLLDFELTTDEDQTDYVGGDERTPPNKHDTRITNVGRVVGTIAYMAPEQLTGEAVTARSDIHALGVTMYGLTYGRSPFEGTPEEKLSQRVTQEINFWPPGRRAPNALRLIMERATQPDPDSRYESVAAMAEDIERFLAGPEAEPRLSGVIPEAIPKPYEKPREEMPTEAFRPLPRLQLAAA